MRSSVAQGQRLPDGDGSIDGPHETSLTWPVLIGDVAGTSGVQWVQVFAQDASRQKLTWGIYGAALLIMMDFVTRFPLYADASYFRIGDGTWGTVGNGYVGIGLQYNGTTNVSYLFRLIIPFSSCFGGRRPSPPFDALLFTLEPSDMRNTDSETIQCYLKGNPALNTGVICQMPSDYPDN